LLLTAVAIGAAGAAPIPSAKNPLPPQWKAAVDKAAPAKPTVAAPKRKVLVFSLFTGYNHTVIPNVDYVFRTLGKKSGAFDATITKDIEALTPKRLAAYDVLVLNNNCSVGPRRNLFLDVLERDPKYHGLSEKERQAKANALEQSLLAFARNGKGIVAIHGAPTLLNNSKAFTEMIGGAFCYHPPFQKVTLHVVDAKHPLCAAFRGHDPFVHQDEPYLFSGCYAKLDFHPLLALDTAKVTDKRGETGKMARYVAWIKPYGKGRVFFCSPSHSPASYENAALLRFVLDGVQYAAGDLKCDDSPRKK
jgi:type 1 glutamine amidotransferase